MRLIPLGRFIRRRLKDLLYDPHKMERFPEIDIDNRSAELDSPFSEDNSCFVFIFTHLDPLSKFDSIKNIKKGRTTYG